MKSLAIKTIKKYLPSLRVEGKSIQIRNLPALYRGIYDFEELDIDANLFLVIQVKDKSLGPKDFKKHSQVIRESLGYPQIWYLKELHFNKVQRMIQNEFNFVIEDKQVHLPSVNVSIKHGVEKANATKDLAGMSVNMLIREILKGDLSGKSKVEISEVFKTTKMTGGRALGPLLANELCEEIKIGVAKKIHFKDRLELWNYLKENISSPVKELIFIDKIPKALPHSGISALSKQSMLAEDKLPTFASDKRSFNKKFTKTEPVLEEFASSKIELWNRPAILQEDNCINVIDIYLTTQEEVDERVQIELEMLLRQNDLEIG